MGIKQLSSRQLERERVCSFGFNNVVKILQNANTTKSAFCMLKYNQEAIFFTCPGKDTYTSNVDRLQERIIICNSYLLFLSCCMYSDTQLT